MGSKIKEQEDRMHNFGILGSWSEKTLCSQKEVHGEEHRWQVPSIESLYKDLKNRIQFQLKEFENIKITKINIIKLYKTLEQIKELYNRDTQLENSYQEYERVMDQWFWGNCNYGR